MGEKREPVARALAGAAGPVSVGRGSADRVSEAPGLAARPVVEQVGQVVVRAALVAQGREIR